MIEIIVALILGIGLGLITGMIPGPRPSKVLLFSTSLIVVLDPVQMIVLYITMIVISQYVDAIPAIYLGVPGEVSAIPAANQSASIRERNLVFEAIRSSALWRAIGSVLVVGITGPMIYFLLSWPQVFSVKVQLILLMIAVIGIWITAQDKYKALFMMIAGYLLGLVGYNFYLDSTIMTGNIDTLYQGLPLVSVLMAIYVVPQLFKINYPTQIDFPNDQSFASHWTYRKVGIRSSFVGYLVGIIPGLSYILSSTICYNLQIKKDPNNPVAAVVASETGSTTGTISSLLPLLIFGIPITISEAVIFNHMIINGAVFNHGTFLKDNLFVISIVFVICNVVGLVLSWPLAGRLIRFFQIIRPRVLKIVICLIAVASVGLVGWYEHAVIFYFLCFVMLLPLGWLLRHQDVLPLVFLFVLQDHIEHTVMTLKQIIL